MFLCPSLEGHTAVVIAGDQIIVYGGKTGDPNHLNPHTFSLHMEQDLPIGRWQQLLTTGLVPSPRAYHSAVAWTAKMIVFGGLLVVQTHNVFMERDDLLDHSRLSTSPTQVSESCSLHILDCSGEEGCVWETPKVMGTVPCARAKHSAALIRETMIVYGGYNADKVDQRELFEELHSLNLCTMTWSVVESASVPPCIYGASVTVRDSVILLFGGVNVLLNKEDNMCYAFCISGNRNQPQQWRCLDSIHVPPPRAMHSAVAIGDSLFIYGGYCDNHSQLYGDLWEFSLLTAQFSKVTSTGLAPSPRSGHAACVLRSHMFVLGGLDQSLQRGNEVWRFDPSKSLWTPVQVTYTGQSRSIEKARQEELIPRDSSLIEPPHPRVEPLRVGPIVPPGLASRQMPSTPSPTTQSVPYSRENSLIAYGESSMAFDSPPRRKDAVLATRPLGWAPEEGEASSRAFDSSPWPPSERSHGALNPIGTSTRSPSPSVVGLRYARDAFENAVNVTTTKTRLRMAATERTAELHPQESRFVTSRIKTPSLSPEPKTQSQVSHYVTDYQSQSRAASQGAASLLDEHHPYGFDELTEAVNDAHRELVRELSQSATPFGGPSSTKPLSHVIRGASSSSRSRVQENNTRGDTVMTSQHIFKEPRPCAVPVLEDVYAARVDTSREKRTHSATRSMQWLQDSGNDKRSMRLTDIDLHPRSNIKDEIATTLHYLKRSGDMPSPAANGTASMTNRTTPSFGSREGTQGVGTTGGPLFEEVESSAMRL